MRKLGRLSTAAFSFVTIANNSFATTSIGKESISSGNIAPLALGALLIICVLFIGYKLDKSGENAPTIKKQKLYKKDTTFSGNKKSEVEEYSSAAKNEIYEEENEFEMPYQEEENEYYEYDNNFDYSGLNEDTEYEEDDFAYSDAVEGLDEKIDTLEDLNEISVSEDANEEEQDAECFMNELNKYKEEAENEEFVGFTTKVTPKEEKIFMKKKEVDIVPENIELPKDSMDPHKEETENLAIEEPSGEMDIGFLNQMEQNFKKNQEERMKKAGINLENSEENDQKKRGRKPKN